jgi:hypothetical protein
MEINWKYVLDFCTCNHREECECINNSWFPLFRRMFTPTEFRVITETTSKLMLVFQKVPCSLDEPSGKHPLETNIRKQQVRRWDIQIRKRWRQTRDAEENYPLQLLETKSIARKTLWFSLLKYFRSYGLTIRRGDKIDTVDSLAETLTLQIQPTEVWDWSQGSTTVRFLLKICHMKTNPK